MSKRTTSKIVAITVGIIGSILITYLTLKGY